MSIYELEERIFFDGALPVDMAETVGSDQDIVSSEQSVDDDLSVDAGQDAIDGDSPADDQDSSESENSQLDDEAHESYESYTSYEGDAAIPDSLLDSLSLPDDYELNPNVIIISTEHENFEEISNSINDNTILIEYSTDDSIETILENLKAELDGIKAVNIGIVDSSQLLVDSSESVECGNTSFSVDELIDALSDLQTVDGVTEIVDTNQVVDADDHLSNGLSISEFFDIDSDFIVTSSSTLQPVDPSTQNEIVFINSSVMNSEEIVDDLSPDAEVVYLDSNVDGIEQITEYLSDKTDIDTIRIISHGNEGYFVLNGQIIDGDYVTEHADIFNEWSNSLTEDADIMLYGCNLAANAEGQDLVQHIADLTGADVAAATHTTGGETESPFITGFTVDVLPSTINHQLSTINSSWALDYSVGTIESSQLDIHGYEYHLANQVVTSNADDGGGDETTLREAIEAVGDGEEITFNITSYTGDQDTVTIISELSIAGKSMTINGYNNSTGNNVTVTVENQTTSTYRVFNINTDGETVTIENMTINGGDISDYEGGAPTDANYGGSIYIAAGDVVLDSVTVSGSTASSGGGIYNAGNLTVINSVINNNTAKNIKDFTGTTYAYGGGIYNLSGTVSVEDSTISDNTAETLNSENPRAYGGGIYSGGGTLTVKDSTISNNTVNASNPDQDVHADAYGGGIAVVDTGNLALENSTVAYNTLISYHKTGGQRLTSEGGGVYFVGNSATISNSTIAENIIELPAVAANWWYHGSGVYFGTGTLTVRNSIIAENTYYSGLGGQGIVGDYYSSSTLNDGGYNVVKYQEFDNTYHPWNVDYAFDSGTSILYNYTSGGATATGWNKNNGTDVSGSLGLSDTLALNGSINGTYTLALASNSFAVGAIAYAEGTNTWNHSSGIDGGNFYDQRGIETAAGTDISIGAYSAPQATLYYKAVSDGSWSNIAIWRTDTSASGSFTTAATETPYYDNAKGIIIDADVIMDVSVTVYQTTINSSSSLTIADSMTMSVLDGTPAIDLTVTGSLSESGTGALVLSSGTGVLYNGGNQTVVAADYSELQLANTTPGVSTTKTFADGITSVAQYIVIQDSIVFTGSSASAVTVQVTVPYDWDGSTFNANATHSGVFFIWADGKNVTISNMTIKGGDISSFGDYNFGGGICAAYVSSSVKLENVSIEGSKASQGGGIFNELSTLEIINSTISYNIATSDGGGILSQSDGTLTIENSTIAENKTESASGGGIHISGSNTISNSTIAHNTTTNGNGGGIFFNNGTLAVRNTIIAENSNNKDYYYYDGTLNDQGYNVVEYQSGRLTGTGRTFTAATDYIYSESGDGWIHGMQPITGTLGLDDTLAANNTQNGTYTLALSSDSFATDAILYAAGDNWNDSSGVTGTDSNKTFTDQRGITTDSPAAISIGAYSSPQATLYYKAIDNGNWSNTAIWRTAENESGPFNTEANEAPNSDNSKGIIIDANVTVNVNVTVDDITVNSGYTLTIADNITMAVHDGLNTDLTVTGFLSESGTGALVLSSGTTVLYNGGNQTIVAADYSELQIANTTVGVPTTKTFADGVTSVAQNIEIKDSIEFTGSSASAVTVQVTIPYNWNGSEGDDNATDSRVFHINASGKTVSISNMTIKGGKLSSTSPGGGIFIENALTVNLNSVSVEGSYASLGGGVYQRNGTLNISDSTISYNQAESKGGGIGVIGGTKLNIINSTISNNKSNYTGIIYGGGGIYTKINTEIKNSTIAHNTVGDGSTGYGGGIFFTTSTFTISNSTIAYNKADTSGGGIYFKDGTLTVRNTIIAENSNNDDYFYSGGTLTDEGYNVVEYQNLEATAANAFNNATDILFNTKVNTDTIIYTSWNQNGGNIDGSLELSDTLEDNGGPTLTLALGSGSFAAASATTGIPSDDHWNNSPEIEGVYTDQRGVPRAVDQNTSVGAYSANYSPAYYYKSDADGGNWDVSSGNYTWTRCLTIDGTYENTYVTPTVDNSISVTIISDATVTITSADTAVVMDNMTIDNGGRLVLNTTGSLTVNDGSEATDLTVNGILDMDGGAFTLGTGAVLAYGSSSTLIYSDSAASQVTGSELLASMTGNVNLNNSNGVTVNSATSVSGIFTLSSGTVLSTSNNITVAGITSGTGTVNASAGTFTYSRSGDQTIFCTEAGDSYSAMTLLGSGTKTFAGSEGNVKSTTVASGVTVSSNVTVEGGGVDYTYVQAAESKEVATSNVFIISLDNIVTISNMTIRYGNTGQKGGGIDNAGTLTVDACTISGNTTTGVGSPGGGIYNSGTLNIYDSRICSNTADTSASYGGGIYNKSTRTVRIENSTVSGNSAQWGGGIYNNDGDIDIVNSTISGNTANEGGGGIYLHADTLTLTDSTVENNDSHNNGGGIFVGSGDLLTLTRTTISGNYANGHNGGGIYLETGTLTINSSTISNNAAEQGSGIYIKTGIGTSTINNSTISNNEGNADGGGIYLDGGTLTINNSTISNNTVGLANGGGIYNSSGTLTINSSTISNNTADCGDGGGIYISSGSLTVKNTIIANNTADNGADYYYNSGTLLDNGYNVVEYSNVAANASGGFNDATDIFYNTKYGIAGTDFTSWSKNASDLTNQTIGLDASLVDNGGWTKTLSVSSDSFLVDSEGYGSTTETTDQRGFFRGTSYDTRGAYQYEGYIAYNSEATPEYYSTIVAAVAGTDAGETIYLAPTIIIEAGISISKNLTLEGYGSSSTYVQAAASVGTAVDRIFNITAGSVILNDMTVRYGNVTGNGGGISFSGTSLILNDVAVTDSQATENGGGIYNSGTLEINDSTISDNTADYGGGVYNSGVLTINKSLVSGNTSDTCGAVYNNGISAEITISNSTISSNLGTGINNSSGTLIITGSVISNNTSSLDGAGVKNLGGNLTLTNSTVTGNFSNSKGGGIYSGSSANTSLDSCTIAYNHSDYNDSGNENGGGIYINSGTLTVKNTIIVNNIRGNLSSTVSDDYYYEAGSLTDNGYNVIEYTNVAASATGGFNNSTDILYNTKYGVAGTTFTSWTKNASDLTNQTLELAASLVFSGGYTQTLAVTGSGFLSVSEGYGSTSEETDQRGYYRISTAITRGAYQYNGIVAKIGDDTSWTGGTLNTNVFTEIDDAYNAAQAGDIIELAGTTIFESGIDIDEDKAVTIRRDDDLSTTTYIQAAQTSGTASDRIFNMTADATVTLQDLIVRYGNVTGHGGGISQTDGTLILNRVTVSDSEATGNGNGIYSTGNLTISNIVDLDNNLYHTTGTVTFTDSSSNLKLGATSNTIGGTFTAGEGTVTYDGACNQEIIDVYYNTLKLAGSCTKTAAGNLGAETVTTTTENYNIVLNGGGEITNAVTFSNTGSLNLGNDSSDVLLFSGGITAAAVSEISLNGQLRTSGDSVLLGNNDTALILTGTTSEIDTTNNGGTAAGSNITIGGVADSTTAFTQDLTLNGGTGGIIEFDGVIGGTKELGDILISNASAVNVDAAVTAKSFTVTSSMTFDSSGFIIDTSGADDAVGGVISITSTGQLTVAALTTTGGADADDSGGNNAGTVSLSGGDVTISGTITATGSDAAGADTNGGSGGAVSVIATDADPKITLSANIDTLGGALNGLGSQGAGGDIDFNDAVVLGTNVSLTTGATAGNITFDETIDGTTAFTENLTLNAGTGTITLNGAVGCAGVDSKALKTLKLTDGSLNTNNQNITVSDLDVDGGEFNSDTTNKAGTWNISGDVDIASGATLNATTGTFNVGGDWTNSGTFTHNNGTVTFNGTEAQSITSGSSSFYNVTINNSSNTGVKILDDTTISHNLILTDGAGLFDTNSHTLTVDGTISGSDGNFDNDHMIITNGTGYLKVSAATVGSYLFPVGTYSSGSGYQYSPATVELASITVTSGEDPYLLVTAVGEKYSDNPCSTDYLNRYWDIDTGGIDAFSATAEYTFLDSDVVGDITKVYGAKYNSVQWTRYSLVDQANLSFTTASLVAFGVFTGISAPVASSVVLSPAVAQNISAGQTLQFAASAYDQYGNEILSSASDYTWVNTTSEGLFNNTTAGAYAVTATYKATSTESSATTITVTAGEVASVELDPSSDQSLTAGETLQFTATAYDQYGNEISSSASDYTWVNTTSEGLFNNTTAGAYAVTATYKATSTESSATTITVTAGEVASVELDPSSDQSLTAGETLQFTATAYDQYDNEISSSASDYTWVNTTSEGLFNNSTAGTYAVTATYEGITSSGVNVTVTGSPSPGPSPRPDVDNGEMINDGTQTQTRTSWRNSIDNGAENSIDNPDGFEPNEVEGIGLVMDSIIAFDVSVGGMVDGEYSVADGTGSGFMPDGEYGLGDIGVSGIRDGEYAVDAGYFEMRTDEASGGDAEILDLTFNLDETDGLINFDGMAILADKHPTFKTELDLILEQI